MLFNSYSFILLFLPATVVAYHWTRSRGGVRAGNLLLLLVSFLFYGFCGRSVFCFLLGSMAANYLLYRIARQCHRHAAMIRVLAIALNVLLLFLCKYCDFFLTEINSAFGVSLSLVRLIVPIGLSFFTFSQISFVASAIGTSQTGVSILEYGVYIAYFPKLLMGPIVPFEDFLPCIQHEKAVDWDDISEGLRLFAIGLAKKSLLANAFSRAVGAGFAEAAGLSSSDVIIVMLSYTFEIYFDFSGYSDMACGISKMLNIDIGINFNSPYKAVSVRDFWKRWHISLTRFLTRYVYFPLGGSRLGALRTCFNILVVFLVSGLWHGANWTFILWGLLHGLLMVFERLCEGVTERIPRLVRWLATFCLLNVLWLLFRCDSVAQWRLMLGKAFSGGWAVSPSLVSAFACPEVACLIELRGLWDCRQMLWAGTMVGLLLFALVLCVAQPNPYERRWKNSGIGLMSVSLLLWWGIVSLGGESKFIYLNF